MIRPDLSHLPDYRPGKRHPQALKLSSNESNQGPLPAVEEAMAEAARGVNRYPNFGVTELRAALAKHLGLPDLHYVAAGVGSSALCQQLVQITRENGSDEVIYPWRSFEAYPIFIQIAGAKRVPVPLTADHRNDLPAMAAAINQATKLIFICNPNNPTGTVVTRAEFEEFMALVPSDILVALDEAYFEYNRQSTDLNAAELVTQYPNLIGLRTFSKAYGLAGLRVGYAFGNPRVIAALNKVALPFGVNSIAQAAALASLEDQDNLDTRVQTTITARQRCVEATDAIPSESNFVWFPGQADKAEALADRGVLVRAFPEGLRVTITDDEELEIFLAAWAEITA